MKFNVSSRSLYACLAAVGRIINSKNALSILNNFRLELSDNILTVTASDGENFLHGRLQVADAEGSGAFCVDAKRFSDLLKDLPDTGINVTVEGGEVSYNVMVEYANGEFNFVGYPGDDYPEEDAPEEEEMRLSFTADTGRLLRGIDNTVFAVGSDELRPQMMGILWDVKPERLVFVATDTRKLVKYSDFTIQAGEAAQFILPLKSTTVFRNVFQRQDTVRVIVRSTGVRFESAEFSFNSRIIVGKPFPDYDRVIPQNNPYTVTIDRATLQSAVRRIGAFCEAANGLVRFRIEPQKITLKASESSYNTSAWESAACDFNGQTLVIGFSAPYVLEILSTLTGRDILIYLADPSRPGVFVPAENEADTELKMLLMPMLVAEF